jgi:hypothetical protein
MTDGELARDGQRAARRVVFLGASNLTRTLQIALATAHQHCGGPLDVLAAFGHGRSYGKPSRVLWRELPGIRECGLWRALAESPPAPAAAVVTDIGNDLLYGATPETIANWIDESLANLAAHNARTTVTMLPLASVQRMWEWQYRIARRCIFPKCRISFADILDRARDLDARLRELAGRHGAATVELPAAWFGFDAIHLRRSAWRAAWREILADWRDEARVETSAQSLRGALAFRSLKPAQRRMFGVEQRFAQPCATLRDGTTIALY